MLAAGLKDTCSLCAVHRLRLTSTNRTSVAWLRLERRCILRRDKQTFLMLSPEPEEVHSQVTSIVRQIKARIEILCTGSGDRKLSCGGDHTGHTATVQGDHSVPRLVPFGKMMVARGDYKANSQFLVWWLHTEPCPNFPSQHLRFFPQLLVPAELPVTRPVHAQEHQRASAAAPMWECLMVTLFSGH